MYQEDEGRCNSVFFPVTQDLWCFHEQKAWWGRAEIKQLTTMFLRHRAKKYDLGIEKGHFLRFELVLHDYIIAITRLFHTL